MKVEIKTDKGKDFLVITAEINKDLPASTSGKSKVLCSTQGNKPTEVKYNGETVILGATAYIKAKGA